MAIVILLGLLAVAIFMTFRIVRGPSFRVSTVADLEKLSHPVDLVAFRNLLDPSHAQLLRIHIPHAAGRLLQRRRKLIHEYLSVISENCVVLLRLGERAQGSESAEVRAAGAELVSTALRCRLLCIMAIFRYKLAILARVEPTTVVDRYLDAKSALEKCVALLEPERLGHSVLAVVSE